MRRTSRIILAITLMMAMTVSLFSTSFALQDPGGAGGGSGIVLTVKQSYFQTEYHNTFLGKLDLTATLIGRVSNQIFGASPYCKYSSSNESIAYVQDGKVYSGNKNGRAYITVTLSYDGRYDAKTVTVDVEGKEIAPNTSTPPSSGGSTPIVIPVTAKPATPQAQQSGPKPQPVADPNPTLASTTNVFINGSLTGTRDPWGSPNAKPAKYANNRNVNVLLTYAPGVTYAALSENPNDIKGITTTSSKWRGLSSSGSTSFPMTLSAGDGLKSVYVLFKKGSNILYYDRNKAYYKGDIILDTTPPAKPSIKIDPAPDAKSATVTVDYAGAAASIYRIGNGGEQNYSGPFKITDNVNISAYGIDNANNRSETASLQANCIRVLSKIDLSPSNIKVTGFNTTGEKFTVKAIYSDGYSEDVTTSTYWSTNNTKVAWVKDGSDGTARSYDSIGKATITAMYPYSQPNQKTAQATITVEEPKDTTPPEVTNITPSDGTKDMRVNEKLVITFSKNIAQGPNWNNIYFKDSNGNTERGYQMDISVRDSQLIFTPNPRLEAGKTYIAFIPIGAIQDTLGNDLRSDIKVTVTTKAGAELNAPIADKPSGEYSQPIKVSFTTPTVTDTVKILYLLVGEPNVPTNFPTLISSGLISDYSNKGIMKVWDGNPIAINKSTALKAVSVEVPGDTTSYAALRVSPISTYNYVVNINENELSKPVTNPSPTSSGFNGPIQVTFVNQDDYTSNTSIYYTLQDPKLMYAQVIPGQDVIAKTWTKWNGEPFTIQTSTILRAVAVETASASDKPFARVSRMAVYTYTINISNTTNPPTKEKLVELPKPQASKDSGKYDTILSVKLLNRGDYPKDARIYYALDGSKPGPENKASRVWSYSVSIRESGKLQAVAVLKGQTSEVASFDYTIVPKAPRVSPRLKDSYNKEVRVRFSRVGYKRDTEFYYTLDGSTPTTDSELWDGRSYILIDETTTLKAIAVYNGESSDVATFQYNFSE